MNTTSDQLKPGTRVKSPSGKKGVITGWVSDNEQHDFQLVPSIQWDAGTASTYRNYERLELLPHTQLSLIA